ncbi:dolichol phosphate-mannose biosynthesis regulatory [Leucosporidium creatinivorum]|uniref:Dolichol phosphate-mannose biosynthesis regulatory protein n=1 Tax=Leucosporidium creatinivorum TaxID=106004 RepID=A0A1Y2FW99_9BASI|nr:dolichol phosphate-mannose biosynthesis regulatory [Leucosporidium creatinivorum]
MALTDKLVGGLMLITSITVFTYYTLWTLFTPFLPPSSPLHSLFPSREWAIRIPALLMLAGLAAIGAFVGLVLVKSARKKRAVKVAGAKGVKSN